MGVVIPFADFKRARTLAKAQPAAMAAVSERAMIDAMRAATDQATLLAAARPLLDLCRDRYGFVVMLDGLPRDPEVLGGALLELSLGLSMLDAEMGAPRIYPTFGVYFGRQRLAWFEDGYSGETGLAVPNDSVAAELAAFLRPRIAAARPRTHS